MIYEFVTPECTCHVYLVRAETKDQAIEKFLKWQEVNLDYPWPEDIIKDEDNWMKNSSTFLIGF